MKIIDSLLIVDIALLQEDPNKRLTAQQLLESDWLREHDVENNDVEKNLPANEAELSDPDDETTCTEDEQSRDSTVSELSDWKESSDEYSEDSVNLQNADDDDDDDDSDLVCYQINGKVWINCSSYA